MVINKRDDYELDIVNFLLLDGDNVAIAHNYKQTIALFSNRGNRFATVHK